jgi:uncharacterized protein
MAHKRSRMVVAVIALIVVLVAVWLVTRDRAPNPIRIATGAATGLNRELILTLSDQLGKRGYHAQVLTTGGSLENHRLLLAGQAEMAIVKAGAVDLQGLEVVAPLHQDAVILVARKGRGIRRIEDLTGKRVVVGAEGSGTLQIAHRILQRYSLTKGAFHEVPGHYTTLLKDPTTDAALVSTGLTSPELLPVLGTGNFDVLPIEDARALALLNPFFFETSIPRALYRESPPVPATDVTSLSTWSLLVARPESSFTMIEATLAALYDNRTLMRYPMVLPRAEAAAWSFPPLHPASQGFFDPYRGLGTAANLLQSLDALKELCLALAALLWLGWQRYRSAQEEARDAQLTVQKERLDAFVDETIRMEEELLTHLRDPEVLERLFQDISHLKLRALSEMTHEELRTDRGFTVLMTQCRDLVEKIQRSQQLLGQAPKPTPPPLSE